MEKQKTRQEIDEKYKWDLTGMYENIEAWEKEVAEIEKEIADVKKYEGHLLDNAKTLKEGLDTYYALEAKLEKVYVYANALFTTDLGSTKNQDLSNKATNLFSKVMKETSFISPEILKGDYDTVLAYEQEADFSDYHLMLKHLFEQKEHALDKEEELLFSNIDEFSSNFSKCSGYLRDQIMEFDSIHDANGNIVELTSTNYSKYNQDKNRNVRKEAYESMKKTYGKFTTALATNYIGHIRYTEMVARTRKYKNVLDQDLKSLHLPSSVFEALVNATKKHLDVSQKEYALKKQILKVDPLEAYDLSAPLLEENETEYSYEEAREIILKMTKIYGEEYYHYAKKLFDNRWIDVLDSKNKRDGWYQNGSYLTHPIIFANYQFKYYDVSSLAHELGHAVHQMYAVDNNSYPLYEEPLFLAEVASLTNEMVLAKSLLQENLPKQQKLEILNTIIDVFGGNYFGGVKGAEFESKAHNLVSEEKPISPSILNEIWHNLSLEYTGGLVDNLNEYGWSRIPHFFVDFYYYKYATGVAMATVLSDKILYGTDEDRKAYLNFLKVGGSKEPIDALKVAGIDITNPEIFEKAIDSYDKMLDEYLKIYNM